MKATFKKRILPDYFRKIRKQNGISVEQVVRYLKENGVTVANKTLYGWETGVSFS